MRESLTLLRIKCKRCGETIEPLFNPFTKLPAFELCEVCEKTALEKKQAERITQRKVEEDYQAEEERTRELESATWRRNHVSEMLVNAGVMKRFVSCSLENFKGKVPPSAPAFITGPPGTGKTHLAVGFMREELLAGRECRFLRAVDLLKQIRGCFQGNNQNTEVYILSLYGEQTDFLVIDDLGTEKASDFAEQTLYDLIDCRYSGELSTIITSNLSLDALCNHFKNCGDRLVSRIVGMGNICAIKGHDRRLTRSGY